MSSEPIIIRQLDKVANGIGYICIFWAWLDDFLGEMILKLCPFDPRKIINTDEEKLNQMLKRGHPRQDQSPTRSRVCSQMGRQVVQESG
jgi:hypothetical protein